MKTTTIKNQFCKFRAFLILAGITSLPCLTRADVELWIGNNGVTATTNWSDTANWSGTSQNPNDNDVRFFDNGTAPTQGVVNNVVDTSTNCYSLTYANTNQQFHTTLIQPGQTLTIDGNSSGNSLVAGSREVASLLTEYTTITGTGGALRMNGGSVGTIFVGQGGTGTAAKATLDMQGLDTFTANVTRLMIGVGNTRYCGVLYLARTNTITLSGASPQLDIGDNSGNNGGGSLLYLGMTNVINVDSVGMGLRKQNSGNSGIRFNPAFTNLNPVVIFRGTNGPASAVSTWAMGDGTGASATVTETGVADFTGGTVNAVVNSMWLARPSSGATGGYTANGTFTFNAGNISVNNLTNASLSSSTGPETATGVVNVNGGTLAVNNNLVLAALNGFTGTSRGTLNVVAGTMLANNIIAAGGTSAINVFGGTLAITNAAGTTLLPITTVALSNATLQVSVGSLNPEVVATTLNTDGSANTINIASLPVVVSYPQQFPLIQYSGGIGGAGFNFALGTLPAGAPAYQGYISNNISSVDLVLTNGPVVVGLAVWNGTVNSNWDLSTLNWTNLGVAAIFHTGDLVQFDDTAHGPTNVNLTANLNPSAVTVSNFNLAYTFGGPGAIIGSSSLTKYGNNTLTLANNGTNTFAGGITINAGTLQFGNGGTGGNLPANNQPITDNGNLILNLSNNMTVQNAISGTGNFRQNGAGVVSLTASNGYSGATVVNAGSLMVDNYIGGGGSLSNAAGATIGGTGTNIGPLNASGILNPGDVNAIGTYSVVGDATLYASANPTFDLSSTDPTVGNNVNDLLQVAGNLTANNNTLSVAIRGIPQSGMSYGVMGYSGNLAGSFNSVVGGTHYAASVDTVSVPNQVYVLITGTSGANMKWQSTGSGIWDSTAQNWLNIGTSLADNFYSGDTVLFDDSVAGVATNIVIPSGTTVYPTVITNVSSANSYTISGGSIGGTAGIVKNGTSLLTLGSANSFSGEVDILAGTLKTGNGTSLGTTAAGTVISSGATLDVNGQNLGGELVTVSGTGVGGLGALVNSGAAQVNAFRNVTLTGDATFGGTGRWDIRGGSATLQASGSPVTITKIGTNQISLVACVCSDVNLQNLNILQGVFAIQTSSTQFGDPAGFINVSSNAFLNLYNLPAGLDKNIVLNGGGGIWTENSSTTIAGTVTLTNAGSAGIITNQSGTTLIVNSVINGPGDLVKRGSGTTQLAAVNTHTGSTSVGGGTMTLNASGAIDTSPSVSVSAGATLDVTAIAPWNLAPGQKLQGSGTVSGDVTVPSGSTILPGSATATGVLTDSGNVILQGSTVIKLSAANATNDVLAAATSLTYGGTLTLTNISGTLTGSTSYKIFDCAAGYSGAFTSVSPATPGPNMVWNTNNLATTGTISIVSTANPNPTKITTTVSGGTLTMSWPADYIGWRLQTQTNSLNVGINTNWVEVPGASLTNQVSVTMNSTNGTVFYRMIYP